MTEAMRPARPDELPGVSGLMSESFPAMGRGAAGWEKALRTDPRGGPELLWVAESRGELMAACHLLRFEQWIGGVALPLMGLAKVAVSVAHRKRGLGRRMVVAALRHARERGDLVSALYPFRPGFYASLGYGMAGQALQYRFAPEMLPTFPERDGVRVARSGADRAAVREVYALWIRGESGQLSRGEEAWGWFFDSIDHTTLLYRSEEGVPEGYVLVRSRTDPGQLKPSLEVEERGWLTARAQRAIYGWLATVGDEWQEVAYRAHPTERFDLLLRDQPIEKEPARWGLWFTTAALLSGPMFRILELPAALRARAVPPGAVASVNLDVVDEQLPENHGRWHLRIERGAIEVARGGKDRAGTTLALSIGTLSQLYLGSVSPTEAVAAGLARVDDAAGLPELDRALSIRSPWTFTRF